MEYKFVLLHLYFNSSTRFVYFIHYFLAVNTRDKEPFIAIKKMTRKTEQKKKQLKQTKHVSLTVITGMSSSEMTSRDRKVKDTVSIKLCTGE